MSQPEENFTWIPFYRELARKLLDFRDDRAPLVTLIYENPQIVPATNYLHMRDGSRCADIDPFSFFGIFNRGISAQSRSAVLAELKKFFALDAALPRDFDGIPILDNRKSFYLIWNDAETAKKSAEEIWAFFESMMRGNVDAARFSKILNRSGIGPAMLTMPMFWCAPEKFLPLDQQTQKFLKENYDFAVSKISTFDEYVALISALNAKMASGEITEKSFAEISASAWRAAKDDGLEEKQLVRSPDGVSRVDLDISKDEWKRILQDPDLSADLRNTILRFYAEPEHKSSAKAVGEKYGVSPQRVSGWFQGFGRFVQSKLHRFRIRHYKRDACFWAIPAKEGKDVGKYFEWTLRDELVAAIEELGLTGTRNFNSNHYEYYVVSPNFHDDLDKNVEKKIEFLKERKIIAVGHMGGQTAERFRRLNPGDRIICAQRKKFKWAYHFIGTIRPSEYPEEIRWMDVPADEDAQQMSWGDFRKSLAREGWSKEEIEDSFSFDGATQKILQHVKIQYWELDNFQLIDGRADGILEHWSGNKKNTIGTLERIKNEHGENEEVIRKLERLFASHQEENTMKKTCEMTELEKDIWELLRSRKNIVLHGAPGTGKTFLAKTIAAKIGCGENEIKVVQFHPSYDYTDFVEGLRPVADANGNVGFERRDGVFKEFCRRAQHNILESRKSEDELSREKSAADALNMFINRAIEENKTYSTKNGSDFRIVGSTETKVQIEIPGNAVVKSLSLKLDEILDVIARGVRFHAVKDVKEYFNRKLALQDDSYFFIVCNELQKEMSKATASQAVQKIPRKDFVFIIDEINRGELGKIFGELFGAIEPGYRGEKGRVDTQYQNLVPEGDVFGKGFFVPENVYIIGTMNDIDRSVESMDFAMRRRFAWEEIMPEANAAAMFDANFPEFKDAALARMNALNAAIAKVHGLGRDYAIGPACFLPLKDENGDFGGLWKHHLAGTLREYLRGNPERDAILNDLEKAYDLADEA